MLGAGLVALVVFSFVGESEESASTTTAGLVTTTTGLRGFPPAGEQSVCRMLITTTEVEALVGRTLEHPVIEPTPGQCAWPVEQGTPKNAELFFQLEPIEGGDLAGRLATNFAGLKYTLEPVADLGDEAFYAYRLTDPRLDIAEDFVEGLYVSTHGLLITLASGGRDIWAGTDEEVKGRLRLAMGLVAARVEETLGTP